MEETRKIGNVATRVRTVQSCVACPVAIGFQEDDEGACFVLCQGEELHVRRRLSGHAAGSPPDDCPLRREALFVALAAAEVIK